MDEAQNLTPHEVKTIISRAAEGPKIVLCGDPFQIDNPYLVRCVLEQYWGGQTTYCDVGCGYTRDSEIYCPPPFLRHPFHHLPYRTRWSPLTHHPLHHLPYRTR